MGIGLEVVPLVIVETCLRRSVLQHWFGGRRSLCIGEHPRAWVWRSLQSSLCRNILGDWLGGLEVMSVLVVHALLFRRVLEHGLGFVPEGCAYCWMDAC